MSSFWELLANWACIFHEYLLKLFCEEITGSNQSALCDGRLVRFAKRSDISAQQDLVGELDLSQNLPVQIALYDLTLGNRVAVANCKHC